MKYRIRVAVSFDDLRVGEESWVDETPRLLALVERGYLTVVEKVEDVTEDGPCEDRPSGPEESEKRSVAARAPRRSKAGRQQGEGPDAS